MPMFTQQETLILCPNVPDTGQCDETFTRLPANMFIKECTTSALAGVAPWTERGPTNQRVVSLIPGQGTSLGCRARSPVGGA